MSGRIIDGYREVMTRGTYPGETGTGYGVGPVPKGLISADTRGRYDGYREPVRLQLLRDDVEIETNEWGPRAYLPKGTPYEWDGWPCTEKGDGLDITDAVKAGWIAVLDP